MARTVDEEALEYNVLYYDMRDEEGNVVSASLKQERGSTPWTLYETIFTTPNKVTELHLFPVLVHNRGEVWIDDVVLEMETWEPPLAIPVVLNWFEVHYPDDPFTSETELKIVEEWLKTIPTENFWGIIFIREEIYRTHISFNDNLNTTWFGEALLGYPLYLVGNSSATEDDWKSEMYLRMIRGFHNYFSPLTKVGITMGDRILPGFKDEYYGESAIAFIQEHMIL